MLVGAEVVVHAAAFVEEWGTREQFWQGNVEGTTRMLAAAKAGGVRRFLHVGTEAALFDGHDLRDVDESAPYPARQRYLYSETKAEAERRVLAANAAGFETLSVRPRLVWGPRDTSVLPTPVYFYGPQPQQEIAIEIDEDRVHTMKSHDARGVTLHVYAGNVASFRLFDETARVTLRARGGAWLPADVVLSEERWEPVP